MSLDVYLEGAPSTGPGTGIFLRENGGMRELTRAEWDDRFPGREPVVAPLDPEACFTANITHNLGRMADAAGLYRALWHPEEHDIRSAADLAPILKEGLRRLEEYPEIFTILSPLNGWGTYEGLVRFVREYLEACESYPEARVRVSR